jgi:hypothetical protein
VRGEITQSAPFYRAKLEVESQGANGESVTHTVDVAGESTKFSWPITFRVRAVVLDPHFRVLHWLPGLRSETLAHAPGLRAAILRDSGKNVLGGWSAPSFELRSRTLATIAERISHSHPALTVAGATRIEHHRGTCGDCDATDFFRSAACSHSSADRPAERQRLRSNCGVCNTTLDCNESRRGRLCQPSSRNLLYAAP